MSALLQGKWSRFSVEEWHRLQDLAVRHEGSMRLAYLKAALSYQRLNDDEVRTAITFLVAETCDTTAELYGLVFNPESYAYVELVNRLVYQYHGAMNSEEAKRQVTAMLPKNLGVTEYMKRMDTYGLDVRGALRIERMRQEGMAPWEIAQERNRSIQVRANLIATTETNRVINQALLTLWRDNLVGPIEKARRRPKVEYIGTTRRRVMETANKTWMTRRDEKVCKYCDPLDGVTSRLDAEFDTRYGIFDSPPIHPNCRCYMILG